MTNVYFGFPLKTELHHQLASLIARIQQNSAAHGLNQDAGEVITRLLDVAIQTLYYNAMDAVPTHPGTRKSADAGIGTVVKGAQFVIQKMANSLDPNDLLVFANYMQTLVILQDGQHYLAYPLTADQKEALEQVIHRIQTDANTDAYNHLIIDVLCSIADQAIKYFYDTPTRMIKIRTLIRKSADLAVRSVCKGLHFVIRQLFRRTRQKELMMFSDYLQQQLVYC